MLLNIRLYHIIHLWYSHEILRLTTRCYWSHWAYMDYLADLIHTRTHIKPNDLSMGRYPMSLGRICPKDIMGCIKGSHLMPQKKKNSDKPESKWVVKKIYIPFYSIIHFFLLMILMRAQYRKFVCMGEHWNDSIFSTTGGSGNKSHPACCYDLHAHLWKVQCPESKICL